MFKSINQIEIFVKLELCVAFVDISLRASFDSASHFSKEIRARKFAWPLKRHTVLYRLTRLILPKNLTFYNLKKSVYQIIEKNFYCSPRRHGYSVLESVFTKLFLVECIFAINFSEVSRLQV